MRDRKPVFKANRKQWPWVLVETMDTLIALDSEDNARWYSQAWPNKMGMSWGEIEGDQYGSTVQAIRRDGKQVGIRWDSPNG